MEAQRNITAATSIEEFQRFGARSYLELLPTELYRKIMEKYLNPAIGIWLFMHQLERDACKTHCIDCDSGIFAFDHEANIALFCNEGITVYDLNTLREIKKLPGHTQAITSAGLSIARNRVISRSGDKTVKIWDFQKGTCLKTIHEDSDEPILCQEDTYTLIKKLPDRYKFFSIDGNELGTVTVEPGMTLFLFYNPKNQLAALYCNRTATLQFYDIKTDRCVKKLFFGPANLPVMHWYQNNQIIVDAGKTIKAWDNEGEFIGQIDNNSKQNLSVLGTFYNWFITHKFRYTHNKIYFVNPDFKIIKTNKLKKASPIVSLLLFDDTSQLFLTFADKTAMIIPLIDKNLKKGLISGKDFIRDLVLHKTYECYMTLAPLSLYKNEGEAEAFKKLPQAIQKLMQKKISIYEKPSIGESFENFLSALT